MPASGEIFLQKRFASFTIARVGSSTKSRVFVVLMLVFWGTIIQEAPVLASHFSYFG